MNVQGAEREISFFVNSPCQVSGKIEKDQPSIAPTLLDFPDTTVVQWPSLDLGMEEWDTAV